MFELHIPLDLIFRPYQRRRFDTGISITPTDQCIICIGKSAKRPSPLHTMNLMVFKPGDDMSNIVLEIFNPTSRVLENYREAKLALIIFAIPLSVVHLDMLRVQHIPCDSRSRTRCPVSILAMSPNEHTLDIEVAATKLSWRAFPRGNRIMTSVSMDIMRADMRRYNTVDVLSCSHPDVYVDQITVSQDYGTVHITFVTKYAITQPPSALGFKLLFKDDADNPTDKKKIVFPRYPDPTVCLPYPCGLKVFAPQDIIIKPGHTVRTDICLSYTSRGAYLGLFTPSRIDHVCSQIVVWEENENLTMFLKSSTTNVEIRAGQALGDLNFLPCETVRRTHVPPSMTMSTKYTIQILDPNHTKQKRKMKDRRSSYNNNNETSGKQSQNIWNETSPHNGKRKRPHSTSDLIDILSNTRSDLDANNRHFNTFTDLDDAIEIVPSGAVFKLKHLIPLMLSSDDRDVPCIRGLPKKIVNCLSFSVPSQWEK